MSTKRSSRAPSLIAGGSSTQANYSSVKDEIYETEPAVVLPTFPHLSKVKKLSYGVGHVFNDLCASMWFTYLILFYHKVVELDNVYAGMLILIGQVADAAATPIIGLLCDKTHVRYGRRKLWHLIGTSMVAVSLFFIWHTCLVCPVSHLAGGNLLVLKMVYFSIPIIVFQFGWASVQISHLSLIPELTNDKNERVGLNAIRYSFTILANIGVYVVMFLLLKFVTDKSSSPAGLTSFNVWSLRSPVSNSTNDNDDDGQISPEDVWIFSGTALGIIAVGVGFSALFQLGTREPYIPPEQRQNQYGEGKQLKWYLWFIKPQFYLVAVIYMCTRLMNNITQAYTPLFLVDTLQLSKTSVAIGPLVIFTTGFLVTLLLKFLNRVIGRYLVYFLGLALMAGGLIWFWATDPPGDNIPYNVALYGATVLLGAGGSAVLVTSLSMVADLIGCATGSSAFVYGLMSFTDKLSSGVVIQLIQALHPCKDIEKVCCAGCAPYYRKILVIVPGVAVGVAAIALVFLSLLIYYRNKELQKLCVSDSTECHSQVESININSPEKSRSVSPLCLPVRDGENKSLLHS